MLILCFLMLIPLCTEAFQNEPDNFRGIKWGTELSQLPEMYSCLWRTGYDSVKTCRRKNDHMRIGEANLKSIRYRFYKEKFAAVLIECKESSDFSALKQTLFSVYGEGVQSNQFLELYTWPGNDVRIDLKKDFLNGCNLTYVYLPLDRLYRQEQYEKEKKEAQEQYERAKKGADDL